ncbi:glycosyltransferase [Jutongia sp.]
MKISVVISTYNGSRYIQEQLDSIRNQTRMPDEVLIFDDDSSDNTYEIISDYINLFKLDNWKLQKNPRNYGWRKSFMHAISCATGDLIFTADQDDIWCLDKIEKMSMACENNSKILVLVADYQEFQFDNVPVRKNKKDTYNVKRIQCDDNWYYIKRPGCVFALRKEIVPYMIKAWYEDYAHDVLMWQIGILLNGLYHIEYTAIYFRRHDSNATPLNYHNRTTRINHAYWALRETAQLEMLFNTEDSIYTEQNIQLVRDYYIFTEHRLALLRERKVTEVIWLMRNRRKYLSGKSLMVDIVCSIMKK